MRYRVTHTTTYRAEEPVSVCHNAAWLAPRDTRTQRCEFHEMTFHPEPSIWDRRTDIFGNQVTHFSFNEGYRTLQVTAESRVALEETPVLEPAAAPEWEAVRDQLRIPPLPVDLDVLPFVFDSPRITRAAVLGDYARVSFTPRRPIVEAVLELTARLFHEFEYDPRATTVTTPVDEVMQHRKGVCQDFAHVQIGMLRSLGLAARYVSGYVRTSPSPDADQLVGGDASHAWLSVYCGDLGWVDVDPTNNKLTRDEHITLAWGRDYGDVSPIKGVYVGGGQHALSVSVHVTPLSATLN
jgi:transglutaminase-like putative cysteine protease